MVALLASRWFGILAIVLAVLVAWGRVFVGVHYPGDVLGGLAIGALCAVFAWMVVRGVSARLSPARGTAGLLHGR
jgi:membrane-associated phospholipid phosphatase